MGQLASSASGVVIATWIESHCAAGFRPPSWLRGRSETPRFGETHHYADIKRFVQVLLATQQRHSRAITKHSTLRPSFISPNMVKILSFLAAALLAGPAVLAHPGHDVAEEAAERAEFFKRSPKTLRKCAGKLKARGHESASIARRQALADHLRVKRGLTAKPLIHRRDFGSYNFTHLANTSSISLDVDETTLFADNSSCTLQTDVTQGPYYVNGELIRQNLVEDQEGVPLTLDIQIIDTSTCDPVPAIYMDLWHCNSTGVYSGVVASGNGNSNDTTNLNNTALRGIQQTDSNGVVQFETLFPGHYTGKLLAQLLCKQETCQTDCYSVYQGAQPTSTCSLTTPTPRLCVSMAPCSTPTPRPKSMLPTWASSSSTKTLFRKSTPLLLTVKILKKSH